MKIAHIVSSYPPYYGGMGNIVFETVSELASRGHQVEVITPQVEGFNFPDESSIELEERKDFARRLKPSLAYGNAARLPSIGRVLDEFDLVHLHYPFFGTANLVRKWKKKNPHKPLVMTYHMDTRSPDWKGLIFKYYAKYWLPKVLSSADALIASSFDFVESSQAAALYHENGSKWHELPFGVNIERFQPRQMPEELVVRHNLNKDLPTLLFVGGMDKAHYFKGVSYLLDAVLFLKKQGIHVQLVLVGDGELRQGFELRARGFGISDRVCFVGKVSDEELPYYYNLADLFVLPSINQGEAFGLVLLEAMASGVPVVASNLPGVRSVAKDGGEVFEPKDARDMAEAISDFFSLGEEINDWRRIARQVVEEKYAWGPVVDKLEGIYSGLVRG